MIGVQGGGKGLVCMGENKDWCAGGRRRWGEGRGGVSYSFNWVTAGILSFLNK